VHVMPDLKISKGSWLDNAKEKQIQKAECVYSRRSRSSVSRALTGCDREEMYFAVNMHLLYEIGGDIVKDWSVIG